MSGFIEARIPIGPDHDIRVHQDDVALTSELESGVTTDDKAAVCGQAMNCEIEAASFGSRFEQFKGQTIVAAVVNDEDVDPSRSVGDY
jgi:hypothetical protein